MPKGLAEHNDEGRTMGTDSFIASGILDKTLRPNTLGIPNEPCWPKRPGDKPNWSKVS